MFIVVSAYIGRHKTSFRFLRIRSLNDELSVSALLHDMTVVRILSHSACLPFYHAGREWSLVGQSLNN